MCALSPRNHNVSGQLNVTVSTPRNENQVFIVRIRALPREIPGARPLWRGEIEQLNTGRKAFLKGLEEIMHFIQPVLEEMGMETIDSQMRTVSWRTRIKRYLFGAFQK